MELCQITMGEWGNYFECGKPAKFTVNDSLRGVICVCGLHARAINKRAAKSGLNQCTPIERIPDVRKQEA